MDGWFYARLAYEAAQSYATARRDCANQSDFANLHEDRKQYWKVIADAVLRGAAPEIEMRATQTTLPPLDVDPDSSPTPVCVPHPNLHK